MKHSHVFSLVAASALLLASYGSVAAPLDKAPPPSSGMHHPSRVTPMPEAPDGTPFAEHFVVFHISSGDGYAQKLVLNNAQNILNFYGPDKVVVEVVAYGPGLRTFFRESAYSNRIKGMAKAGIKFSACANTMRAMGRPEESLNPIAKVVSGGVVRITELQEAGWTYIRP